MNVRPIAHTMTLTLLLVVVPISIGRAADATGWTPELKDKEVTTCRVAVVNRIIAKAARAANTSPDDIRGKLKADSLAEASLEAEFSFACKCFIGKVAAGMSHADYMATPSQTIWQRFGSGCPHMKIPEAAGYMFEYVQNIESHAGFCSEHFPSLAPALSEKLGAWRKEDEFGKVIRVTTYFATKVQDPEKTKENLRKMREPLESLSNEKRVASCQGFLRAFQAKKWREWRSDPRFQVLEEFDFWIHPH